MYVHTAVIAIKVTVNLECWQCGCMEEMKLSVLQQVPGSILCQSAAFSWPCGRTWSTWYAQQRWRARRRWPGCQSAAAVGHRWPWRSAEGPSGSWWSSALHWPHPALTHLCSPGAAVWLSGRKTTDLRIKHMEWASEISGRSLSGGWSLQTRINYKKTSRPIGAF